MIEVFKVVRPRSGKIVSAILRKSNVLEYSTDKWTEPQIPNSGIFVFTTLRHAQLFAGPREEIWQAEAESVQPLGRVCRNSFEYEDFWLGKLRGNTDSPLGTFIAPKVRLVKRLWKGSLVGVEDLIIAGKGNPNL